MTISKTEIVKQRKQIVIDLTTATRLEKYLGYKDSYNKVIVMLLDAYEGKTEK